jgi:hypothetical protein
MGVLKRAVSEESCQGHFFKVEYIKKELIIKKKGGTIPRMLFILICGLQFVFADALIVNAEIALKVMGNGLIESTTPLTLHSYSYFQDFEKEDPFEKWKSNGTYTVNYKGLTTERSSSGKKSFKIDITFGSATYVCYNIPIKVPSVGTLSFNGNLNVSRTTGSTAAFGTNISLAPIPYSSTIIFEKQGVSSTKWTRQSSDLVLNSAKKANILLSKFCAEATIDDVGIWTDSVGVYLFGKKGDKITVFIDNISLKGVVPAIEEYTVYSNDSWKKYKIKSERALREFQKIVENNKSDIYKRQLALALKRGYLNNKDHNLTIQLSNKETNSDSYVSSKWYVRPHGYKYQFPMDGRSKKHAFYGLNLVKWGEGGVKAGDVLILCREESDPEYFTRTLTLKASGSFGRNIVIESENSAKPECIISENQMNFPGISGYDQREKQQKGNYAIAGKDVNYIKFRNIKIENCYGCKFYNLSNITITNFICNNTAAPIWFEGGRNNIIENCKISNFIYAGIALIGSNPDNSDPVSDCLIIGNNISGSLDGDGITLHKNSHGIDYDIGSGNKVLNNSCSYNQEEGLDITAGSETLVEFNETYKNGRSTTIAHSAENVTFTRNYSHDEPGVLVHPSVSEGSNGNIEISYNIIDSGNNSALVVSENSNYKIYNNIFRSSGRAIKPATVDIRLDAHDIFFGKNIVIATEKTGYTFRMAYGTPHNKSIRFEKNCWWQPTGASSNTFFNKEKLSYSFKKSEYYNYGKDDLFLDPKLLEDFSLSKNSPCLKIGIGSLSTKSYPSKVGIGQSGK